MGGQNANLLSGALFVAIGTAFLAGGLGLPAGTAQRMGPGWFPVAVSASLIAVGALVALRGVLARNPPRAFFVWRPLLIVSAALALFIATLDRLGLPIAIALCVVVSAYAHPPVRLGRVVLYGVALAAFCSFVFVRLLGLQMPIVGAWLIPWFGHWN